MRLADAPIKRMLNGRVSQEHSLFRWLRGYPDSIQDVQPAGYDRPGLTYLVAPDQIAPDQIALGSFKLIESEVRLALRRTSPAGPKMPGRVGSIGNLRQRRATGGLLGRFALVRLAR